MVSTIVQGSGTLAIRGILALLLGIAALILPVSAFWALVIVFGAYAFVDGVFALMAAITARNRAGRGWLGLEGIAGIVVGGLTFIQPVSTAKALIVLVSVWALITGILKIVLAIRLRREIRGEWFLVLSGAASIVFGLMMMAAPLIATLALIWVLGVYAVVLGGLMIALSVRVRQWERSLIEPLGRAA